jgi:hypothetical protein
MRQFTLAAGVACAVILTSHAGAQFDSTMPGQVVGSYRTNVTPVGRRAPAAAPQNGQTITNGSLHPYDPNHPYDALKGTNIDPNLIVGPLMGPDGKPASTPDTLDRLSEQIKSFFGLREPNPPRPPYAPGITRRTRDRNKMLWRRD